jgi:hypothetical protein
VVIAIALGLGLGLGLKPAGKKGDTDQNNHDTLSTVQLFTVH